MITTPVTDTPTKNTDAKPNPNPNPYLLPYIYP